MGNPLTRVAIKIGADAHTSRARTVVRSLVAVTRIDGASIRSCRANTSGSKTLLKTASLSRQVIGRVERARTVRSMHLKHGTLMFNRVQTADFGSVIADTTPDNSMKPATQSTR